MRKTSEYELVYSRGRRIPGRHVVAFAWFNPENPEKKVGYTASRALGKATRRNRIKRRLREAIRLNLPELPRGWMVVFNAKRSVLDAPFSELLEDVRHVFQRCQQWRS